MTKKELQALSKEDRESLIKKKTSETKYSDSLVSSTTPAKIKKLSGSKAMDEENVEKNGMLDVTIVCNTANFCDSHMDVLASTAYDESIKAKGNTIPHIADHKASSTSHVGDVTKVYTAELDIKALGYNKKGTTTALLMDSTVRRDYNEEVYKFYKNGKIQQHSIGLRYGKIELAMDSEREEDIEEKAVWDANYESVINKELIDKKGYFWFVSKIDIIENSCVLFGANSLTPTLQVKADIPPDATIKSTTNIIGNTMELEQALARIKELESDLVKAKAEVLTVKGEIPLSVSSEQTRILGVLEAAKKFGLDNTIAIKQVKANTDLETVTMVFEAIKEGIDATVTVPTKEPITTNPTVVTGEKSANFMGDLHKFLDTEEKQETITWGNL